MNLFDIFEGAIDDLEARRIEDLEAKMDDYTARAQATSDPRVKEALRHEYAKAKAERDSYYKINVDEAPGAETLAHNQATDASNLKALGLAEEDNPKLELLKLYNKAMKAVPGSNVQKRIIQQIDNLKKQHNLEEHGGGGGGPAQWHAYVKAHRTNEEEIDEHGGGVNGMNSYVKWRKNANKERGITKEQEVDEHGGGVNGMKNYISWRKNANKERGVTKSPPPVGKSAPSSLPTIPKGTVHGKLDQSRGVVPKASFDEGWQDFNKVEPYAVCLAGKPIKKFDYYEEARRFHDNWKQKLYREGDKAKADKITLMPLNLGEAANPAQQAAIAINMKKHHQKPKHTDEAKDDVNFGHTVGKGSWIVYDPATKQIKKRFVSHTAGKSYAQTHKLGFASSEYYFDNVKEKTVADEASMSWASHKPTGPKFGGYLKGTDPAPTEFSKKSFGAESEEMEEGIAGNMTVKSAPITQPLRQRNFVAKNAIQSGAGKHANQLKKAAAAGRHAKHKGQPLDLEEGENFLSWAVRNGYNLTKPAVYESARSKYKALVEDCGPIAPHETYYGAMDESLKQGEYYVWTVYFDDGTKKRIKVTSDEFDPYEYYAKQKKNVVNVDYNWDIQQ